jgi:arylsulfatase A-like enzyme
VISKPNIIFIFADQLRYSALACHGNRLVRTPHIDRLAREGVVYDQAFSSCPICSPYRGQLLTGRYSHANGVLCNEYRLFDGQTTIADALGQAGYRTAFVGKWHLGYGPYREPERYGFQDMFAYDCDHRYYRVEYWHNEEGPFPMVAYAPRVETQLTLDYIRDQRRIHPDEPFCLFLSWGPPHWTGSGGGGRPYGDYPQEYSIYDPRSVDVPGNVPAQFEAFARAEIADYYSMISSLDDCLGRILAALDEWGLAGDTIMCFSSDHGDHLSSHGYGKPGDGWMHHTLRASKATPHEESVHIPFILRYPARVKGGCRTTTLFTSVDVMPTLLGLCGVAVPNGVQGRDLSHAALGVPGEEPDSVYLQILGPGWPPRTKWVGLWRGLRTERYVYARWHDRDGMRLLFDRAEDPLEMTNLIDDPAHAALAAQMEERLRARIAEVDDPFDTGQRLPVTEMLDLGQTFISDRWVDQAPQAYVRAIMRERSA